MDPSPVRADQPEAHCDQGAVEKAGAVGERPHDPEQEERDAHEQGESSHGDAAGDDRPPPAGNRQGLGPAETRGQVGRARIEQLLVGEGADEGVGVKILGHALTVPPRALASPGLRLDRLGGSG